MNKDELLKKLREEKGLTQIELSKKSGVSYRTITNIEQGYSKGNDETWRRLMKVLGDK